MILLVILGIAIIAFSIWLMINEKNKNKRKIEVEAKVVDVKEKKLILPDGSIPPASYKTTFEFKYNGAMNVITMITKEKYAIGDINNAIYVKNGIEENLYINGNQNTNNYFTYLVITSIGILFTYFGIAVLNELSFNTMFGGFGICLLLMFSAIMLVNKVSNKTLDDYTVCAKIVNTNGIKEIDNADSIKYDSDLTKYRYEDIIKKVNKGRFILSGLFFLIICLGIGLSVTFVGTKKVIRIINMNNTYSNTIATIKDVYKYKPSISLDPVEIRNESVYPRFVGVVYEYEVDGKIYTFDNETGKSDEIVDYKEGEKVKIYYEEDNPENIIIETETSSSFVYILIGVLFIIIGIYVFIVTRTKKNKYQEVRL